MKPEIWGGVECTVNRVGSQTFDQLERSGHDRRIADLDRFAELGLKTLRYPVLWEKVQPNGPEDFDWTWTDGRLGRLRELGIRPIVGLLHHGSGPHWTDLLDPEFPDKFAAYALAVAQRYPRVDAYTPVNEPLTTARFSALYGHWFPHRKDELSFVRALLNQVQGVALAMQAIRSVQPKAQLVQTEDLGKSFSTELLRYQADFENERRWMTFDLLAGRFAPGHPLWNFVVGTGVSRRQLDFLEEEPCVPDIFGINYYVTSDRFLDEDFERHPRETHGGNFFHRYADVTAVRARPEGIAGVGALLRETWERYHVPVAVTEAHLGCTREEQIRWLAEIWRESQEVVREGVDCRGVTAWALLGAFDWNTLVTSQNGDYEPGAFDVRGPEPRSTAIAGAIRSLTAGEEVSSPALGTPGWWRRNERLPEYLRSGTRSEPLRGPGVLVLGGRGNLGQALGRICERRGLNCHLLSRYEADICDGESVRRAVAQHRPWAVINAAGYTLIDEAEADVDPCFAVNSGGAATAARICGEMGIRYATFSCDLVFDGWKADAYLESDATAPLNVMGRTKEEGEKTIRLLYPEALVIRTSSFFGPWDLGHFASEVLCGPGEVVVPDTRFSPTYLPDLCDATLDLLLDGESGLWHLANQGEVTWKGFAERLAHEFQVSAPRVRVIPGREWTAERPAQMVLASRRAWIMPSLESAVARFRDAFMGRLPKPLPVADAVESGRT